MVAVEFVVPVSAQDAAQALLRNKRQQQIQQQQEQDGAAPVNHALSMAALKRISSGEMLPWWSLFVGQGLRFASLEQCAAFLCHPLANIGPAAAVPLACAAGLTVLPALKPSEGQLQADGAPEDASTLQTDDSVEVQSIRTDELQAALQGLARSMGGAVASASAMLRVRNCCGGIGGTAYTMDYDEYEEDGGLQVIRQFVLRLGNTREAHAKHMGNT